MQTKSTRTSFETDDLKDGEFIAYPSTFTRTPDDYGDVVAKGAFADTIKDWKSSGKTLPVMYMHNMSNPEYNIGGVEDMGEDAHGWWIKAQLDMDNPVARQVYKLVKAGRLSQLSFAFDVQDAAPVKLADGTKARELRKVKVYEASIVPVGANQDTSIVAMKSAVKTAEKVGKTLSDSTSAFLTNLQSQVTAISNQIQAFLDQNKSGREQETKQAEKPKADVKDEEPQKVKSEDQRLKALSLATQIAVAIDGRKD